MMTLTRRASDELLFELAFLQYYLFGKIIITTPFKMKDDFRLCKKFLGTAFKFKDIINACLSSFTIPTYLF